VIRSFDSRVRKFSCKVDSKLPVLEVSDPFHGRVRNTKDFIDKLKSKARSDCLDTKEVDLAEKLSKSDVWDDSRLATDLSQELAAVRERLSEITNLELSLSNTVEMYNLAIEESDGGSDNKDIVQECYDALQQIEDQIEEKAITELMVGKYDKIGSCFLQINAGVGGTEACDWVGMIFRMYRDYSKLNGFTLTIVDENVNDEISHVGYRSITLRVKGASRVPSLNLNSSPSRAVYSPYSCIN
jgi:peptide chain release factor 2